MRSVLQERKGRAGNMSGAGDRVSRTPALDLRAVRAATTSRTQGPGTATTSEPATAEAREAAQASS